MTHDPAPPTVGPDGSQILTCAVSVTQEVEELRYLPPAPPSVAIWKYDLTVDDWIYVRDRTDEEIREAYATYHAALERYHKTGGVLRRPGPVEVTCEATCEGGLICEGVLVGGEWRWVGWRR